MSKEIGISTCKGFHPNTASKVGDIITLQRKLLWEGEINVSGVPDNDLVPLVDLIEVDASVNKIILDTEAGEFVFIRQSESASTTNSGYMARRNNEKLIFIEYNGNNAAPQKTSLYVEFLSDTTLIKAACYTDALRELKSQNGRKLIVTKIYQIIE